MKKTNLILVTLIVFLFILVGAHTVYGIDLNLINNVRENELNSAENLSVNTSTNTSDNTSTVNDIPVRNNTLGDQNQNLLSTNISSVTTPTDGTLSIGNILNILLVVVGVLLILLGIAIMIRMNR